MIFTFLLALMGTALVDSFDCYHQIYLDGLERAAIAQKVIAKLKGTSGQKEHFFMVLYPVSSNRTSKIDRIIYCEKFIATSVYADAYISGAVGIDWANVKISTAFDGRSWTVVSIDNTNIGITKLRLAEVVGKAGQFRYTPAY